MRKRILNIRRNNGRYVKLRNMNMDKNIEATASELLYRYELYYADTGQYVGKGFMTGLGILEDAELISYKEIKKLLRPFARKLEFPIVKDKTESTSLFTTAGRAKFAKGISGIRDVFETNKAESGIEVRCIVIPKTPAVEEHVLYEDEHQTLIEALYIDTLRKWQI